MKRDPLQTPRAHVQLVPELSTEDGLRTGLASAELRLRERAHEVEALMTELGFLQRSHGVAQEYGATLQTRLDAALAEVEHLRAIEPTGDDAHLEPLLVDAQRFDLLRRTAHRIPLYLVVWRPILRRTILRGLRLR